MLHILTEVSKFTMLFFMLLYTFECFHVFQKASEPGKQKHIYILQRICIFALHFNAFVILYCLTKDKQLVGLYLMQSVLLIGILVIYSIFYKNCSRLLLNNMCLLLTISFVMLSRMSTAKSFRQFLFTVAGFVVFCVIPLFIRSGNIFRKFTWIYAGVGIAALLTVIVIGSVSYGAKLSISIGGLTLQPSEFVKIIFVFFIASMLRKDTSLKQLIITSAISAVFVLCLVASKDLGGALLYFVTYLMMIYVATGKIYYFLGGTGFMAIASVAGYFAFSHVRTRVLAWKDPLSVYEDAGYQVSRSLFGIGSGGWFGFGLGQGRPDYIPVVEKDFIFSAISEELGGVFALCLIMVCLSCFLMMTNISLRMSDHFYKLVALGLSSTYAMQVILTVGGAIKFIPSTGVTLPFVSYGGSSLLSTFIVFGIIQGLYMRQNLITEAKKAKADHGQAGTEAVKGVNNESTKNKWEETRQIEEL